MTPMRKVVYVSYIRLTDKVSRDWYIDFLIEKNVTVEYWDICSLVRNKFDERHTKTTDYLRTPITLGEVEAMVRLPENRDAYYVMLVSFQGRCAQIFRILSRNNCRLLHFLWGAMPEETIPTFHKVRFLLANPARLPWKLFNRAKILIFKRLGLVKPFDIVFAAGHALLDRSHYATKVVPINLCDYDHYMRVKSKSAGLVRGHYAVFQDINLAYQSDIEICGLPSVNPLSYFQSLNKFFALLEAKYGIRIVIAAHPKADYRDETFQGRAVYSNLTAELTRDADFVISHTSTALSYAVLNLKPVLFIYTTEMLQLYKDTVIRDMQCYANYLDASCYNLDEVTQVDQISLKQVCATRYEKYKYSFLTTHETEHTSTQEIFWREIRCGSF